MTEFAIARYGASDWRLVKWDGSAETEIATWAHDPTFEEQLRGLSNHYSIGNSPFPSKDSMIYSHVLTQQHPIPTRDMTLADEVMPWNDE